ncbi:MAG: ABC transporter permease [Vulcanimicrobiota bacterium]
MGWNEIRESVELNGRATLARAYARIAGSNRELSWLAFDILLPLLGVCAYVYLYKALKTPPEFLGYVILGGAMVGIWMGVLWGMAAQLYFERERGQLETVLMAPSSTMALLMGMALGGIYNSGLRAAFTFAAGVWIFKVPIHVSSWFDLIVTFMLTLCALYGLGMVGSSVFLTFGRNAWHVSSLLQEPVFLVSGFYFPVKSLGMAVTTVASLIPVTIGLDAMRQILFSEPAWGFLPVKTEFIILLALTVLYFFCARKALKIMEEKGRREGRLTLRWQ